LRNTDFQGDSMIIRDDELIYWVKALRLTSLGVLKERWGKLGLEMGVADTSLVMSAAIYYFDRIAGGRGSFLELDFSPTHVRPELVGFLQCIGLSAADIWINWVDGTYLPFRKQGPPSLESNKLAEVLKGIESGDGLLNFGSDCGWLRERLIKFYDDAVVIDDVGNLSERDRGVFSAEGIADSLSIEVYQLSSAVAYGKFWLDVSENLSDEESSSLINFVTSTN